ncbi:MAG: N-acetylmuramoyl-L-alanine amidase [Cyanobacteria bacterium]|nr:N-acetylmuramoyl-L-alanine amidase [Cyanobacteriota bacterium]
MGSVSDWQPEITQLYVENLQAATKLIVPIQHGCFSFPVSLVPGTQMLRLTVPQVAVQDRVDIEVCCLSHPVDYFENLDHVLASWSPLGQVKVIPDYTVTFTGYIPERWLDVEGSQEPVRLSFQEKKTQADCARGPDHECFIPLRPDNKHGDRDTRQAVFAELHQVAPVLPLRGYCFTQYQFPKSSAGRSFTVSLAFAGRHHPLPLVIEVLSEPILGELRDVNNPESKIITRYGPTEQAARACPLLPGTLVRVPFFHQNPVSNNFLKETAYSAISPLYWVPTESIVPLQTVCHSLREPILLKLVTIETMAYQKHTPKKADRVRVTIPLLRQPLIGVISKPGGVLEITLSGVQHACDFIHFKDDTVLDVLLDASLAVSQTDQVVLNLTVSTLAGFDWTYENGELCIDLQFWPESIKDLRVLIDPGHGGEEPGGISMTGVPEKTLNALCAGYLHQAFKTLGLNDEQIQFTRSPHVDATVTLTDRARIAKETRAHVLVSLHHNALPDGRDPQQYRGISTYYYHPFSRPLALGLYHALTQAANSDVSNNAFNPMPGFGVLFDSLAMTRITTAQAVLVELGFMTHPEDSMLIYDPAHQALLMSALAEALVSGPAISHRHHSSGFLA